MRLLSELRILLAVPLGSPDKGGHRGLATLKSMNATAPAFTHGWAQPMLKVPGVRSLPFISRSTIGATSAKRAERVRATRC